MNVLTYTNYPYRPYPPFREPEDWREATWRAESDRDLARIYQLVDDAGADHEGKHGRHDHPWCPRCTLRMDLAELGCPPELATEDHEAAALEKSRNRCSRWMTLHRVPPRDDFDPDEALSSLADDLLDRDELDDLPEPDPLIPGVLDRHAYALLVGRDGTYKTFVALDWSLCLATGKAWQGRSAERVRVLYVAGEGAYGIRARVEAWEKAWRTPVEPEWFTVLPRAVDLYGGRELVELLGVAAGYGLVVLDTLRRVSGKADGNGSEMGTVVDNIDRIRRATDEGSVLALAHTGKTDDDARGFSGIEDDADIVWHAKRDEDRLTLKARKMKNGPDGERVELRPSASHGSLIIEAAAPGAAGMVEATAAQRRLLDALGDTFLLTDGATPAELMEATGMAKSTFYHARAALLSSGSIESNGTVGRPRYRLAASNPVQSASGDITAGQEACSPTSPTESNGPSPVQSSPTPLKGLDVGHRALETGEKEAVL